MAEIDCESLTTYEVSADGRRFRMNLTEISGQSCAISLPSECLSMLLMTLPRIASHALRAQTKDSSLRIVFSADEWRLERSGDSRVILTIGTVDGFEASFAFEPEQLQEIADNASKTETADVLICQVPN